MRGSILLLAALWTLGAAEAPKVVDLSLKDAAGRPVSLQELRGRMVVLNFWATWCGPCNAEMPMLVETAKKYAGRGVEFIGVSLDGPKTRDKIPEFAAKYQVMYPIWWGGTANDMSKLKMGEAAPATAFLDAEGHIVARIEGQMRTGEIEERLEWLLGDRKGPAPKALVKHL